jgi:O-acetylserine/cysteine efflux transporter
MSASVRPAHLALALAVVAVWGTNFVVIKVGLEELPPFLFATLRFLFCAIPFAFFLARPAAPWHLLAAYGVLLGPGQFGLLFWAMRGDISPGLAALVIQMQVFFTIALSVWLFREALSRAALLGSLVAASGLATIALDLERGVTAAGIAAVLAAALCWALANTVVKTAARRASRPIDMLAFVAWASLFAVPPLVALTLVFEGEAAMRALASAGWAAWAAVAWQVIGNTLFGFAAWSWLLTRYDAATIGPHALLIPVFGMISSAWLLGEPMPAWKLVGGTLVLAGIAVATLGNRARSA